MATFSQGDIFRVIKDCNFNIGDIVILTDDDGTECPEFTNQDDDGDVWYESYENLEHIGKSESTLKGGDEQMARFIGGDKLTLIDVKKSMGCGTLRDSFNGGTTAYIVALGFTSDGTKINSWTAFDKNGNRVQGTCCTVEADAFRKISGGSALGGIMAKVTNLAKRLLDADTKAFIEAGVLNKDLTLTDAGREFILEDYLETNKKTLAAKAKALVVEAKKETNVPF